MTFLLYSAGISSNKSTFISPVGRASHRIYGLFPFRATALEEGFKYLGFTLKPNCYCKSDWYWLLERIKQRIGKWSYKWLSIGGRLALAKSTLEGMPVYWFSLFKMPKYILQVIRKHLITFIWSGNIIGDRYHQAS